MTKEGKFEKILKKNSFELRQLKRKSSEWFIRQSLSLQDANSLTHSQIMRGGEKTKKIQLGSMILFIYDPKFKEILPYYDTLPLVFPFEAYKDGFIGLNLHYLPYNYRARLLDKLMEYRTNNLIDENTRLAFTWQTLKTASKTLASVCVKRYLYKHVRSSFKIISPLDWGSALLMPVEKFEKESLQEIWKDSLRKIKKK